MHVPSQAFANDVSLASPDRPRMVALQRTLNTTTTFLNIRSQVLSWRVFVTTQYTHGVTSFTPASQSAFRWFLGRTPAGAAAVGAVVVAAEACWV